MKFSEMKVALAVKQSGPDVSMIPVAEVARLRGCSVRTIKRDVQRKLLPEPFVLHNRWYFKDEDLREYERKLHAQRGRGTFRGRSSPEDALV